ncbi:MAG: alpha/beta fold hydrolase [Deltaproteobacteria bacterium]|nr:alpha/beta fold hydrolase [Deltaproteobacteria bacterium]
MSELLVPEGVDETYWLLNQGLALYQAGHYFEAHEAWEQAWNGEVGQKKRTLQVLIQVAAALHKHREGNPRGPAKLLARSREILNEVLGGISCCLSLDLVALAKELEATALAADRAAQGEAEVLLPPKLPAAAGSDRILYLHGFASGPSSAKVQQLVPALVARGYQVEVPDLNEDDFSKLTLTRALARARRCLADRTLVIGSSMGGYLASLLAAQDQRVIGLVLMAPAFELGRRLFVRHGEPALARWKVEGTMRVEHHSYGGQHPLGYGFYEDAQTHAPRPTWRQPTVAFQGLRDQVVPPELVAEVLAERPNATLHPVDDDHGLVASAPSVLAATFALAERLGLAPWPKPADPAPVLAQLTRD